MRVQACISSRAGQGAAGGAPLRRSAVLRRAGGGAAWLAATGGLALAAAAAASARGAGGGDAQSLVRRGMDKFRRGDVEGSVEDFDAALAADPRLRPYLWQRGLSLYYTGEFEQGAKQFRDDVAVNPNDTEESIWALLCEAQLVGPEAARAQVLAVGRDPRPVMRAAWQCFATGRDPDAILAAARGDAGGHDTFYAQLYVGLWHEAHGDAERARAAITAAVETPYARQSGDYMAALARVHAQRRGWAAA
ncbi:hypothetical protein HT031_002023 [Scenedesmus sp. PABB004]|nr:hypothetical protein HT031_002023 [Scenedesmus sp. PABB004]